MRARLIERMRQVRRKDSERGAAIVAAIGVMIIWRSLGALIVSQAIATQRDSARNRARTVEIHTAEGGVDSLFARMQEGDFVCDWETTADDALGPDEVGAEAELRYWDADGNHMPCDGEVLQWADGSEGPPARVKILVTSDNKSPTMAGIEPVRSFESEILISENSISSEGAAVFSANGIMTTNGASVTTLDHTTGIGNIWVDSGDVDCNSNFVADGSLFVPNGKLKMSNHCTIRGDVWTSGSVNLNQSPTRIGGNLWSKSGPVTMESGTSVGGTINTGGEFICRGCSTGGKNVGNPISVSQESRGLPEVTFAPSDWVGFKEHNYYEIVRQSAVDNDAHDYNNVAKSPASKQHQCNLLSGAEWSLNGPLHLPVGNSILDARGCDFESLDLEVVLHADTVIFANSFTLGGFTLRSEGGDHALWLIVPDPNKNGIAECAGGIGNIKTNSGVTTSPDASIFMYTPCTVDLSNTGLLYGQFYGSPVELRNGNDIVYVPLGIPGVDLMPGYVDASNGWNVDVIYKRETGDRVN